MISTKKINNANKKLFSTSSIWVKNRHLLKHFLHLKDCEIIPAENEDLLVVVTDTTDETAEEILTEKIETIDSLKLLALVSGFNTPKTE